MKGIALPIEMIVIISIAILVLVVIAGFFTSGVGGFTTDVARNKAFNEGCEQWKFYGCTDGDINRVSVLHQDISDSEPTDYNMESLCKLMKYNTVPRTGTDTRSQCQVKCGCAIPSI